jgi:hypothetical protein
MFGAPAPVGRPRSPDIVPASKRLATRSDNYSRSWMLCIECGLRLHGGQDVPTSGRFTTDSSPPLRIHTGIEKFVLDDEECEVVGFSAASLHCPDGERAGVAPLLLLNSRPFRLLCAILGE